MPRSKAAPVRHKRPRDEAAEAPLSLESAARMIEDAEARGWQQRITSGAATELFSGTTDLPEAVQGVCMFELSDADFASLRALHETICSKLGRGLTGWGGRSDARRRGYGYLPRTLGESFLATRRVSMRESAGADAEADGVANARASVLLDDRDLDRPALDAALHSLTARLREHLPAHLAPFLAPDQLVAAQPNLHNGHAYLLCHLDEPLHDGFGVVIATLAVTGSAHILLRSAPWDAERRAEFHFSLQPRHVYALSGPARNTCLHGVLSLPGDEHRASLNLRFGLHTKEEAWEQIDSKWPDTARREAAEAEGEQGSSAAGVTLDPLTQ